MGTLVFNISLSALLIGICVWLSKKNTILAGFIASMPLTTIIVLALTQYQYGDSSRSISLAKSILVGMGTSTLFFIPFFVADRFKLSFWAAYSAAIAIMIAAYFIHQKIMRHLTA